MFVRPENQKEQMGRGGAAVLRETGEEVGYVCNLSLFKHVPAGGWTKSGSSQPLAPKNALRVDSFFFNAPHPLPKQLGVVCCEVAKLSSFKAACHPIPYLPQLDHPRRSVEQLAGWPTTGIQHCEVLFPLQMNRWDRPL